MPPPPRRNPPPPAAPCPLPPTRDPHPHRIRSSPFPLPPVPAGKPSAFASVHANAPNTLMVARQRTDAALAM